MKRSGYLRFIVLLIFIGFFTSCSSPDINNENVVMKDILGTWTGYENSGSMYRHIKLNITEDSFEGWVQTSDSQSEPSWTVVPGEIGSISLTSVQADPQNAVKFRKFNFTVTGRCCGDKSLTLVALSDLVKYTDGKGLTVGDKVSMSKE